MFILPLDFLLWTKLLQFLSWNQSFMRMTQSDYTSKTAITVHMHLITKIYLFLFRSMFNIAWGLPGKIALDLLQTFVTADEAYHWLLKKQEWSIICQHLIKQEKHINYLTYFHLGYDNLHRYNTKIISPGTRGEKVTSYYNYKWRVHMINYNFF